MGTMPAEQGQHQRVGNRAAAVAEQSYGRGIAGGGHHESRSCGVGSISMKMSALEAQTEKFSISNFRAPSATVKSGNPGPPPVCANLRPSEE